MVSRFFIGFLSIILGGWLVGLLNISGLVGWIVLKFEMSVSVFGYGCMWEFFW